MKRSFSEVHLKKMKDPKFITPSQPAVSRATEVSSDSDLTKIPDSQVSNDSDMMPATQVHDVAPPEHELSKDPGPSPAELNPALSNAASSEMSPQNPAPGEERPFSGISHIPGII